MPPTPHPTCRLSIREPAPGGVAPVLQPGLRGARRPGSGAPAMRWAPLLLSLSACLSGAGDGASLGDSGEAGPGPGCVDCVLRDTHNYTLSSTLDARVFALAPQTDAVLDWGGLAVDVQGQAVAPGDIDRVLLVAFLRLSPEEIAEGLAADRLAQSDAALFVTCAPQGATRCALSEFSILGSTLDVEEVFLADIGTWLVALTTGGSVGGRSFAFLQAVTGATATEARLDSHTAALAVDVDLGSLRPLAVARGVAPTVSWAGLGRDGLGNPIQLSNLNELMVARSAWDARTVESHILDLEREAEEVWTLPLGGSPSADLSDLVGPRPFPGIDADGTWWLALRCTGCNHPAPRFLTRLIPGT